MTLALLLTAVTGAWADSFSTEAYTADATLSAVSVTGNTTLTINEGVTVTVNNGLIIGSGATLTVTGGGSLAVNGANGANGNDDWDEGHPTAGAPGGAAITINSGAQLALSNATVIANGGQGGQGGTGVNGPDQVWAASGANGNGFASFPTIDGAVLSYSTNGTDYTEYESGNTTLYRYMKVVSKVTIDVTINDPKTEASFDMPTNDVTVNYELVRDMTVKMSAEVGDGSDGYRIRIKKDGNDYVPVNTEDMLISVSDDLDEQHPIDLTVNTDFTLLVQKKGEGDTWTDLSNEDKLSVGTFRYKVTGVGNYDGTIYSNEFKLFEGYELKIAAGEYATYYKDEALYVEDEDAKLYTITTVGNETATATELTVAAANTPLLVKNNAAEAKTILLIPTTTATSDDVTPYEGFKGTLEATQIAASTATQNNYALNGKEFVWVMDAIDIAANRAWLEIPATTTNGRALTIVFGDVTGLTTANIAKAMNGDWYTLDGIKLQAAPTKKGVYILNGKKVVVK